MNIRYLGHATVELTVQNQSIIVDPFITGNPLAAHIHTKDLVADYVLVTHAHGDHTADVENIHSNKPFTLISNFEIFDYYQKKGINGHPMNIGGEWTFPFGKVKMVNALHSSSFPDGTYGGNPCGYVISSGNKNIYIAGDTSLHIDMQLLTKWYDKIDLAILPIGNNFTMGVKDAIIAAEFIQCHHVLGIHYDTFDWIKINHTDAVEEFSKHNIKLTLLKIGDSTVL